ncbi:MAG: PD40 domain-containing protein [Chloroflexi bacterium]|nr:PD40 domain-containing protein [Chloroflexota bacterium]
MAENVQDLLKQGIEAARDGKKAEARELFEKVVELDETNERGWFWLASVVDSDDEKRICLKNVVQINPNNERAQQALTRLEARQERGPADEEVMPGITRRTMTLVVGGGAVLIALILIVFFAITSANNSRIAEQTRQAQILAQAQTESAATQTAIAAQATETQAAILALSPQPTDTPRFTPVATWTPTPTEGPAAAGPTPLPTPPANISGSILTWSGRDISQKGFLPIVLFPVNGGQPSVVTSEVGAHPDISPDGQRVVYTRYFPVTFDFGIAQVNLSGGDNQPLTQGLPFLKPQMPYYCQTANLVSFVALPSEGPQVDFNNDDVQIFQVYTLNLDSRQFERITNDQAVYTYPALSPDCSRIAVVRNDARGASPGEDIVLIDLATRVQTPITSDLGNFIESSPRWSADGSLLTYAAAPATMPDNHDIIVRPSDGSGTPLVPIRDLSDDINPVFSPDGNWIAFSSNRAGTYDIFIFDRTQNTMYQLTSSQDDDYVSAWKP